MPSEDVKAIMKVNDSIQKMTEVLKALNVNILDCAKSLREISKTKQIEGQDL